MASSTFYGIATMGYFFAMILYIAYLVFKSESVGTVASWTTRISFGFQAVAFGLRWFEGWQMGLRDFWRPPISNLYESIIFFVLCLMLGYVIIESRYKIKAFGAFVTPIAGLALAFIEMTGMSKEIEPLVPALQSNWLLAHVTLSFISYAMFALSFATGLMYLILKTEKKSEAGYIFWTVALSMMIILLVAMGLDYLKFKVIATSAEQMRRFLLKATFFSKSAGIRLLSWIGSIGIFFIIWQAGPWLRKVLQSFNISLEVLDDITYRVIAVGFPIFTLGGLIFGAIWADQAWGVYWSWDPKETWTLITWFVYAFYLHARLVRGWRGTKVATVAVLGFVTVIFTYLGVNILLSGLHSYGSIK